MEAPGNDLIGRAVDGDRDALVELLKRHGPAVQRSLAGRIPRRWRSVLSEGDVLQQTYANAVARISQFTSKDEPAFARWLILMGAEMVERHAERSEASCRVREQIPRCARNDNVQRFPLAVVSIAQRNLYDAIDMLEAEKRGGDRRRVLPKTSDDSFVELHEMLAGTGTTPSGHAARKEARTTLERAIEQLPQIYARVVVMYDLEGRPAQEVAEALERSQGAVFMLRARAHERLHEIMGRTSKFFSDSS